MPSLDGLRFFAFLFVFGFHLLPELDKVGFSWKLMQPLRIFEIGWAGVDVFFVLSGFLITQGLLAEIGKPGYFRRFYAKRLLRIFPLYYGICVIAFVAMPLIISGITKSHESLYSASPYFWVHLQNWWISLGSGVDSSFLGHFWSLAVEEQFYLLWPICVIFLSPRWVASAIIGIAALRCFLVGLASPQFLHFSTIARVDSLLLGSLLAMKDVKGFKIPMLAVGLSYIVAAWPSEPFDGGVNQTLGYSAIAMGAAGLLLYFQERDNTVLAWKPFVYLGKISYGLYVFHWPIIFFCGIYFKQLGLHGPLPGIVFLMLTASLTVGVAAISYRFYEQPFLNLKNRLVSHP